MDLSPKQPFFPLEFIKNKTTHPPHIWTGSHNIAIPHNLLWTILWEGIPDVLEMSKLTIGQ
jgi:hypothetical protein